MSDKTTLGTRMKENFENKSKQFLTKKVPTIIRLDGKAFHTFTKKLDKPFDEGLIADMQATTEYLCANIQGAKCGYTQSDEISILLTDYEKENTSAWFDYNVQKVVSIAASLATAKFNELRVRRTLDRELSKPQIDKSTISDLIEWVSNTKLANFDARVFQIEDKEEVVNCFVWRHQDAEKNSVAMLAQSLFSPKELHKKHGGDMRLMCLEKGISWDDLHFSKKSGSFVIRNTYIDGELYNNDSPENLKNGVVRSRWEVVKTPHFATERDSILKFL